MLKKVMFGVTILFALSLIIGLFGNSNSPEEQRQVRAEEVTTEQSTQEDVVERFFGPKLTHYSEKDGIISIGYMTAQTTLSQVRTEIKRFMNEFMRDRGDDPFEYVSILATVEGYDSKGAKQEVAVYKIEFHYEDAIKVESWPFADVDIVGVVLYENPSWK